jgi:hypothetical protein
MKEHPILFSTPMVQAILEGRKTQTRRIVKMKKEISEPVFGYTFFTPENHISVRGIHKNGEYGESFIKCPYGKKGDVLWVRETWAPALGDIAFKADYSADVLREPRNKGIWKPSIHMPKAAARIWLEITEVKLERVQDISEEDAKAEGVEFSYADETGNRYRDYYHSGTIHGAFGSFMTLWCKINGIDNWNSNPWVWVVKFKVLSTTGIKSTSNQP